MPRTDATTKAPARYTLTDDEGTIPCDLADFIRSNDIDPAQVNAIGRLTVGCIVSFGGGAVPVVTLTRIE